MGKIDDTQGIQKGRRPVIVVSTNYGNMVDKNCVVNIVPLTTSRFRMRNKLPCHTIISSCMNEPSVCLAEQITTIQKSKLTIDGKKIGVATDEEMNRVKDCIRSQFCC